MRFIHFLLPSFLVVLFLDMLNKQEGAGWRIEDFLGKSSLGREHFCLIGGRRPYFQFYKNIYFLYFSLEEQFHVSGAPLLRECDEASNAWGPLRKNHVLFVLMYCMLVYANAPQQARLYRLSSRHS